MNQRTTTTVGDVYNRIDDALEAGAPVEDLRNMRAMQKEEYQQYIDTVTSPQYRTDVEAWDKSLVEPQTQENPFRIQETMPHKAASEDASNAALIIGSRNRSEKTKQLLNELLTNGYSSEIEGIKEEQATAANVATIEMTAEEMARSSDPEAVYQAMVQTPPADSTTSDLQRQAQIQVALYALATAVTPNQRAIADRKLQHLVSDEGSYRSMVRARLDIEKSKMSGSFVGLALGALIDTVPHLTGLTLSDSAQKVFGDEFSFFNGFLRGELGKKIHDKLDAIPNYQDRYALASELIDVIASGGDILTATEYQQLQLLDEALQGQVDGDHSGITRIIGNAISIIDTIGMGFAVRNIWKQFPYSTLEPTSQVAQVRAANREVGDELIAESLNNGVDVGMSASEIVELVVAPKTFDTVYGTAIELLPANVSELVIRSEKTTEDLLARTRSNTSLTVQPHERGIAITELRTRLEQIGNVSLYNHNLQIGKVTSDDGVEELAFRATYGKTSKDGGTEVFTSAKEASESAARQFPDAENVEVFKISDRNEVVAIPTSAYKSEDVGEFVFKVAGTKSYARVLSTSDKIFYKDGDVSYSSWLSKFGADPNTRFAQWIARGSDQAADWGKGIAHTLSTIAKPFDTLKRGHKLRVMELMKKYEASKEPVTLEMILADVDGNTEVLKGIASLRKTYDALYELNNRALRDDMIEQGAKSIGVASSGYQAAGIKVNTATLLSKMGKKDSSTVTVYDPVAEEFVKLTKKNLIELGDRSVYKVQEELRNGNNRVDLVLTGADDISELPMHVLKYDPNYIPRYYKESYFIVSTTKGLKNGLESKTHLDVVAVVGDLSEANSKIAAMKASGQFGEDVELVVKHDRTMSQVERSTIEKQDNIALGRMFYNKKKQHLQGAHGLAEVADPVESLIRAIDQTSKVVANSDYIALMKTRWMNMFGKQHNLVVGDTFPKTAQEIGSADTGVGDMRQQAVRLWEHIRTVEGIEVTEQRAWRNAWVGLADNIIGNSTKDTLTGKVRKVAAMPASWLGENSVNKMLRSAGFFHLIAMNPVRQAFVQSKQWMFISALAPQYSLKVPLHNKAVLMGLTKDLNLATYAKTEAMSAKMMGLTVEEWRNWMKKFRETGIPYSVESHDMVRDSLKFLSNSIDGNRLQRGAAMTKSAIMAVPNAFKNVGFNYGELNNLINTFLVAQNKWSKVNGRMPRTTAEFNEIAATARGYTFSMTKVGSFRYQEGLLSALTQFMSVQHKAALAILPGGSKAFTPAEKGRIAVGQLVLNGVTGLGLYEMYQEGKAQLGLDMPEAWDKYIVGGLFERVINESLHTILGDDGKELAIAEATSPLSGVYEDTLYSWGKALFTSQDKTLIEMAASMNVVNKYVEVARVIQDITNVPELAGDEDRMKIMIEQFGTVFSGYSQYVKARAAMRLGQHVTASGNLTLSATFKTALAEGLFGINQRDISKYYQLKKEFGPKGQRTGRFAANAEALIGDDDRLASEIADGLFRTLNKVVTLHTEEWDSSLDGMDVAVGTKLRQQRLTNLIRSRMTILEVQNTYQQFKILNLLEKKIASHSDRGKDDLMNNIIKGLFGGTIGHELDYGLNRLTQSGLIDESTATGQSQLRSVQTLIDSLTQRRELRNEQVERLRNARGETN